MTFRADLHCHTTCSDGSMTPTEIVHHAKEAGLSALSITDHDTVSAYKEAMPVAKELGLLLGVGAEFSSTFQGVSVHVLAYNFPLDHPEILALCKRHVERRKERNLAIVKKLQAKGFHIDEQELPQGKETVGRPHIADLLRKKGHVHTIKEAFDLYLGDGKCCFDPGESVSTQETIDIIHKAGGKALIAHPHLLRHPRQMRGVFELPFDGVECYYGRLPLHSVQRFLQLAEKKGWLISGGSDFHGAFKEYSYLGSSWVDEEKFHQIFSD